MGCLYRLDFATKGRPMSPEHRAKIAAALKGKPKSAEHVANSVAARAANRLGA